WRSAATCAAACTARWLPPRRAARPSLPAARAAVLDAAVVHACDVGGLLGAVEAELVVGRALARHRVAPPGPDRDAQRAAGQRAAAGVLPGGAQLVAAGAVLVGRGHREQGDGGDRARDRDDAAPALHPLAGVARALDLLVGVAVAGQPVVVLLVDLLVALVQL